LEHDRPVEGSSLTSDGDLILAGGTMTIDATSSFLAGGGVRGLIGAAAGGTARVVNAGVIDLTNGASGATDTLTIRGDYEGRNGSLNLQTVLGIDGSPSDRLIIDGGTVSGSTTIRVTNAGGLGAQTTGDGIEVVSGINGANTTATTTGTGFTLAGQRVDAGAFEYRLFASNQAGTSQSWFLRTQGNTQTETPTPTPTPAPTPTPTPTPTPPPVTVTPPPVGPLAFRAEVPLLAALPGTLRRGDLEMLGTYHRRMGDENGGVADGFTAPGRIWGRALVEDGRFRQRGDARPTTDGRLYGFQIGVDLFRFGSGGGHHNLGVYGGYTDGDFGVRGFASGVERQAVGDLNTETTYAGLYWTYLADNGFYVDTVIQRSWYDGTADSSNGGRFGIEGDGILASVETGYGFALSPNWTLEPQAQIVAQGSSLDNVTIPNATVIQDSDAQITGRLGLRIKGRFESGGGAIQPYLRANLWKAFASRDRTLFLTPAAVTTIRTPNSALWGEAGAGVTWSLSPKMAIYGEADHRFSLDSGRGVRGSSTGGSIGLKFSF
jgi:outer membrane autotransporter protein